MNDKLSAFESLIMKVAKTTASNFPDVSHDDVAQELRIFVLQNKQLQSPDDQYAPRNLLRKAREVCWKERAQHLYLTPQYGYTKGDITAILETVFRYAEWTNCHIPSDAYSEYADLFLIVSADVKKAWEHLHREAREVIFKRYALGYVLDATDRKRLQRALDKLQEQLNSYSPRHLDFVGGRKVISNANARSRIEKLTGEE